MVNDSADAPLFNKTTPFFDIVDTVFLINSFMSDLSQGYWKVGESQSH